MAVKQAILQAKLDAVTANIEALCKVQGIKPAQATRPNLDKEELYNEHGERMFHEVTGRRLKQSNGKPVYKCWFPGQDAQQEDVPAKRFLIVVKPWEDGDLQVSKPDSAETAPALEKEGTALALRRTEG
eukprot:FR736770.1.p1 GENE.FR736770.1~~FR736770.1.p1  ORF type:complete len:138 (+),score=17.58 FR736770.1:29-415(+)